MQNTTYWKRSDCCTKPVKSDTTDAYLENEILPLDHYIHSIYNTFELGFL